MVIYEAIATSICAITTYKNYDEGKREETASNLHLQKDLFA